MSRRACFLRSSLFALALAAMPSIAGEPCDGLFELDALSDDALFRHKMTQVSDLNACYQNTKSILRTVVERGDGTKAKALVERGANIFEDEPMHGTLMHSAARFGHLKLMDFLYGRKVKFDTGDISMLTPLNVAALANKTRAAERLIGWGASVAPSGTYQRPFWAAVDHRNAELASLILKAGYRLNPLDQNRVHYTLATEYQPSRLEALQQMTRLEGWNIPVSEIGGDRSISTPSYLEFVVCGGLPFIHHGEKKCCSPFFETKQIGDELTMEISTRQYIDGHAVHVTSFDLKDPQNISEKIAKFLGRRTFADMLDAHADNDEMVSGCWNTRRELSEEQSAQVANYLRAEKARLEHGSTFYKNFNHRSFAVGLAKAANLDRELIKKLKARVQR